VALGQGGAIRVWAPAAPVLVVLNERFAGSLVRGSDSLRQPEGVAAGCEDYFLGRVFGGRSRIRTYDFHRVNLPILRFSTTYNTAGTA
jgi:hypothetical protein